MRFILLSLLLGFSYSLSFAWQAPQNPKALQAMKRAEEFMDNGAFHYAVDELNRAISLERHPDFYVLLGRCYRDLEKRKLAYFAYKNAYSLEQENSEALVSLGDLALEHGTIKEVEALLPALKSMDSDVAQFVEYGLLCRKGKEALKKGRFRSSYRYYEKALQLRSDSQKAEAGCVSALKGLAKAYGHMKRPLKELNCLLKLYHIVPSKSLGKKISKAYERAGSKAASRKIEVQSVVEHSQSLPDKP